MANPVIHLKVYRKWTERFEDLEGRTALHRQRAKLIHGLTDILEANVEDWGETDAEYPREVVDIVVRLAPYWIPALATIITTWITHGNVIKDVTVKKGDAEVSIKGATPRQIKQLLG